MATEDSEVSTRLSEEEQSLEDNVYDAILKHFKRHKVEISNAIKKEFPFLEILRDRELISDKMYQDCRESCRNLVPVQRVVYNVLLEMEKNFDLPHLEALFSDINKQEYPGLNNIYKSFEDVFQKKICQQECDGEEVTENSNTQLSLEQGTGGNSFQSLTWICPHSSNCNGTDPPGSGPAGELCETEQTNRNRKTTTSDNSDALDSQPADEHGAQGSEPEGGLSAGSESLEQEPTQENNGDTGDKPPHNLLSSFEERAEPPNHEVHINSCSVYLVDIKKEQPFFNSEFERQARVRNKSNQASEIIVISSDDSTESSGGEEPPEVPIWELKRRLEMDNLDSSESSEEGEPPETTCSGPRTAPLPMDLRKSPTCRKRLWETGISHDELSESSTEEEAPRDWRCTGRSGPNQADPADSEDQPAWEKSSKKRRLDTDDASDLSNGEEPPETSSSALRNGSDAVGPGSSSALEKHSGKRREKRKHTVKRNSRRKVKGKTQNKRIRRKERTPKGIKAVNTGPSRKRRKRGPRIPRDKNMNFQHPSLPVTCGQAKGILYKKKMKEGIWAKCITLTDGRELTLREFEIEGNHEKCKNWRLSVRCGGRPLKELIQKDHLPDPPRKRTKTIPESRSLDFIDPYPQNSNKCEVCRRGGTLFCCDSCPRSFHEKCHIQHIDPDSNPWSCIFCQIEAIQRSGPESQPCHQESEVLERCMLPEEQLKCEFLLLKVYCCPESSFFVSKPYYSKEAPPGLKECVWLDKIRVKLVKKLYPKVKRFVQDVRFIFQNHRVFYGNQQFQKFITLGCQLEIQFEAHFKHIFAIKKISNTCLQSAPMTCL